MGFIIRLLRYVVAGSEGARLLDTQNASSVCQTGRLEEGASREWTEESNNKRKLGRMESESKSIPPHQAADSKRKAKPSGGSTSLGRVLQSPPTKPVQNDGSEVQHRRLGARRDRLRVRIVGFGVRPAVRRGFVQVVVSDGFGPRAAAESRDVVAVFVDARGGCPRAAVALAPPAHPGSDLGQLAAAAVAASVRDRVVGVAVGFKDGAFLVA